MIAVGPLWPAVALQILWRAGKFQRVARRAVGFRHRIVADGIEVWSDDAAPKLISWATLHAGRWLVHLTHTMASGYEETYALDLPQEGVALGGYSGELDLVVAALAARQFRLQPEDGGRALGAAGWFVSMLWLGALLLVGALFGGLVRF